MSASDKVHELIERFGNNLPAYKQGRYNETLARVEFINPVEVARHDQMVALVERMLDLHKRLAAESVPHVKTVLQRQIDATDRQIDQLVYELYELTDEEIAVVEGG